MNKRSLALSATLWLLLLVAAGGVWAFDFSAMEKKVTPFTLDNGMTFLVLEDHSVPVVSFVLTADVGGTNDPKERTGLSHMFEHLAFKGTSEIGTKDYKAEQKAMARLNAFHDQLRAEQQKLNVDSTRIAALNDSITAAQAECDKYVEMNEYSTWVEQEGGVGLNAGTGYDNTSYYYSFPSNKLELWFHLESSRFVDPVFRDFYKERDVIKEERRMRVESNPIGRLVDEFIHSAFRAHPYGYALIGQMSEIDNYTPEAAMTFFKKYYVPSNMVAAIVGDVDPAQVKALAQKYFGRLPKAPKPEGVRIMEPAQTAERIVAMPDKSQPVLLVGYHRPAASDPDHAPLQALADYLGGGRTSLLYKNLVKEKKIATQAVAFPSFPGEKFPGLFGIFITPAKGITADSCRVVALAEIERLKNEPIPEAELVKIKARAKANMVRGMSSRDGLAGALANAQILYGDWREMFKELDKINAVTPADIQRVANTYFTRPNRTVAYIETVEE
ncbi:MAG: insulinase family protein [candidate division Zixibacteria bacterium]|nr:insulinase family protein [candidate division Zixibacteria bacterium]